MAGIIARYPFGGVTWCTLMYLLGLRALGHEVFYIEDTGECIYDPIANSISTDSSFGCNYIHNALSAFDLGNRWSFVDYAGNYFGQKKEQVQDFCRDADLYLNLSGGSWFWRDEYTRIPRKAFIDTDPVFTQLAIAKAEPWYVDSKDRATCSCSSQRSVWRSPRKMWSRSRSWLNRQRCSCISRIPASALIRMSDSMLGVH